MDLQWQRQTELWLRLMGFPHQPVQPVLTINQGRDSWYLEQRNNRASLSLSRILSTMQPQSTLLRLLHLLQPEAGYGIPLRAWLTKETLWISAMLPAQMGAEQWVQLSRRQQYLLDRVTDNDYEHHR